MSEGSGHEKVFADLNDRYLDYLSGDRPEPPALEGLPPELQREVRASWELIRILREAGEYILPPIEDDPVAIRLGIVSGPEIL